MTRKPRWPEALRDLELFADCSRSEIRRIAPLVTEIHLDAGRVLIREGSVGREFLVIAEGDAAVEREQTPLAVVGAGEFVGELALLNHEPRTATVTALTPLKLYVSNPGEFADLLQVAPSVRAKITRTAAERDRALRSAAA